MPSFNRNKQFLGLGAGLAMLVMATPAFAQACGGDFRQFMSGVKKEAVAKGISARAADRVIASARINNKVLRRDRAQGVFKQTFLEFSKRSVSANRMQVGASKMKKHASVFKRAQSEYGVPPAVITAFWGLETDFGAFQGDFNTVSALATLAHDCRRPHLFRPQLVAAMEMTERGDLDPASMTGAWAGEIGQVQMLPEDIIRFGRDGDGDGRVRLKKSSADAILTAAAFIRNLGWRPGEPWLQEVTVASGFPWEKSGLGSSMKVADFARLGVKARSGQLGNANLPAALLAPQGRKGPTFLAYPNFNIYLEWNQSFIYTTSAAYFATRLGGAQRYNAGNPETGLNDAQMKQLQKKLAAKGHDVGKIDGILGAGTRGAVRAEQQRLGIPADGWPTPRLLSSL